MRSNRKLPWNTRNAKFYNIFAAGNSSICKQAIQTFVIVCQCFVLCVIFSFIVWRSISMRHGPFFLQFDWSKAGFSMDLPVFLYFYTKASFKLLSRQGRYKAAFYVVADLLLQNTQREPYRALVLSVKVCLSSRS